MKRAKIVFMGTGPFALACLNALWDGRDAWDLAAVYTKAPKKAGRGMQLRDGAVAEFAREKGVPLYQPLTLRDGDAQAAFRALEPTVAVVASYGLILPEAILAAPERGCVNVHGSLLPLYRGAAPVQRAVMDGRTETGVTLMQMDEGLDTGDMLAAVKTPIGPDDTAGSVFDRLAGLGAALLTEKLPALLRGEIAPVPQPKEGGCYAAKIGPEDQAVDFGKTTEEIFRLVRGLSPVPGAFCRNGRDGKRLILRAVRPASAAPEGEPGEIVSLRPSVLVRTGDGALELLRVQPEGKGEMGAADAVNGRKIRLGDKLCR